jgi:Ca2+-binding RTX toxin-like protein
MRGNRNGAKPRSHSRSLTGLAARPSKRQGRSPKGLLRAEVLEPRQLLSATFTVNSVMDDPSGPTSGIVTLRDAINAVNASVGDSSSNPDVINFNISGSPTIVLSADLPALLNPALIDGSSQAGVTVSGSGFAMLVDQSTVSLKAVTFTNGSLTVSAGSSLTVLGDLDLGDPFGDSTAVQNSGLVSVSGSVVGGDSSAINNLGTAIFGVGDNLTLRNNGYVNNGQAVADSASFTVGGNLSIGVNGFVCNTGQSTFKLTGNLSLGEFGFLCNGADSSAADAATFSVGGSVSVGTYGAFFSDGTSTFSVGGDFTLGDGGSLDNGGSSTDAATLTVGGSVVLGASFASVYNNGASVIAVSHNFTVGDGGYVYNGNSTSDAATLTVGGNFTLGVAGGGMTYAYNEGTSALRVTGSFSLLGTGSFVFNGDSNSDAAVLAVGGNFSLDSDALLEDMGSSVLTVSGSFSMGSASYFVDDGTMSVGGAFDPGSAAAGHNNVVAGVFNAQSGSTVTTDVATLEVVSGGRLNVAPGATFTIPLAGTLLDDSGGQVLVEGAMAVNGTFTGQPGSVVVVDKQGSLAAAGAGQFSVQGTYLVWNNPADVAYGVALGAAQLDATATTLVGGQYVNLPGTFTYTLADGSTPAAGAVLGMGTGQALLLTFTPSDTADYRGAKAQVVIGVDKANQSISFTEPASPVAFVANGTVTLMATGGGSGNAVVFSIDPASTGSGTISGNVLTVTGAGSLVIDANEAGNANYNAAPQVQQSLMVSKASQVIQFTAPASPINFVANQTITLTATGGASGNAVLFSLDPSSSGAATISGNVLTVTSAGALVIDANQAGNGNYNAAAQVQQTLVVNNAAPAATLTATAGGPVVLGTGAMLTATATLSGTNGTTGKVTFTLTGPTGATLDTETVNVTGNGTFATPTGYLPKTAGTYQWAASFKASGGTISSKAAAETVVGAGATVIGNALYLVGNTTTSGNSSDQLQITPIGASSTGSTGVQVQGRLNGANLNNASFKQPLTTLYVVGGNGNATIEMAAGMTLSAMITEGNGNDTLLLGNGANFVTLGNGNDLLLAGDGANTVSVGNGNSSLLLGDGSNAVMVGNGNSNVLFGNGNNVVTMGNGNDLVLGGSGNNVVTVGNGNNDALLGDGNNVVDVLGNRNSNDLVLAGNGNNLIVGGLGRENIQVGNGRNMIIDGAVQLTNPGDSLSQVLSDWTHYGAADYSNINSRLKVTYNTTNNNQLNAGSGLDWFWFTDSKDQVNRKKNDLLN